MLQLKKQREEIEAKIRELEKSFVSCDIDRGDDDSSQSCSGEGEGRNHSSGMGGDSADENSFGEVIRVLFCLDVLFGV